MSYSNRASYFLPFPKTKFHNENQIFTVSFITELYHYRRHSQEPEKDKPHICDLGASGPIYLKHIGIGPGYTGHIPGTTSRFGYTIGTETINAKKWLKTI